jgi:aryl-alcohol dehydrogenase-like predicted oxidoreductase
VSSVGLGVQNVSRKYETTVPHRPEMITLIRTAFDRGITFFDTAEAYGPHEAERILGEAIAPFRDKVVITSKFGRNIDQQAGERRPGLNRRPVTSRRSWMACSSACGPTASISFTHIESIPKCPSKMSRARSRK